MKYLITILFISIGTLGFSQWNPVFQKISTPYQWRSGIYDSSLTLPRSRMLNSGEGSISYNPLTRKLEYKTDTGWASVGTSDTVINNIYHGSTAGLRALNNTAVIQANTTDFGKAIYVRDTADHTSLDNWGTLIVSDDGGRFKMQYEGKDHTTWYRSTGASDSAVVMMAIRNCKTGVIIDSGNLELRWIRPDRDNITIEGIPGKTILKLQSSAENGNAIFLFKDSADHNITGVKISGLKMIGNTAGQTGINSSIIAMGGSYGGPATDTVTNVLVEDCVFEDAPTTGSVRFISDTLRNNNWVFRNNTFDSSQGYHVTLWGSLNMTWENNIIKNWANADTSAYPGFNMSTNLNKNLTLRNNQFYNNRGGRFAIEYAGALVNAVFDHNYYNGNGRGGAGTSGGPCVNCQFINEIKENGDGSHRSGYEIVGGGNTFFNDRIENGAMLFACLADAVAMPSGYDSLRNNGLNISKVIVKNSLGGALGLGGQNVNTTGLKNVTLTNSQFETGSSKAAIEISAVRNLVIDNLTSNAKHYNIRFVNSKWSSTDSLSSDIIVRNSTLKASSNIIALGWPNIFINSPQTLTASKIKNVTIENNHYSNNRIFYEDTLVSTWTSRGNVSADDTIPIYRYDRNSLLAKASGSPNGKLKADRGSFYTDVTNNKTYRKTSDNSNTGWVEMPDTSFNPVRANYFPVFGKGAGKAMDTSNVMTIDPDKKYVGFGNTASAPAYDWQILTDSTISTFTRVYIKQMAKSVTRGVSFTMVDGNNDGVNWGYNGSYAYYGSAGSKAIYFQPNGVNKAVLTPSGYFGIGNLTPGYQLTLGSAGNPGLFAMYGNIAGYILIKAPDNIVSPFTLLLPDTYPSVGQVMKVLNTAGGVATLGFGTDNSGGGSGSLEFIE